MFEYPLGYPQNTAPAVNHSQRVVRLHESAIPGDGPTRPPIGMVQSSAGERLGSAIVHEHGDDRMLFDFACPLAAQTFLWEKIDRDLIGSIGKPLPADWPLS